MAADHLPDFCAVCMCVVLRPEIFFA